jgi:hypothetical protein
MQSGKVFASAEPSQYVDMSAQREARSADPNTFYAHRNDIQPRSKVLVRDRSLTLDLAATSVSTSELCSQRGETKRRMRSTTT